jgi:Protein kinase domain
MATTGPDFGRQNLPGDDPTTVGGGPPALLFLPPRNHHTLAALPPQSQSQQSQSQSLPLARLETLPNEVFLERNGAATTTSTPPTVVPKQLQQAYQPPPAPTVPPPPPPTAAASCRQSWALKKAFTDFHNSAKDANSAFLGDDPSLSGRTLQFATRKNERWVEFAATAAATSNSMKPSKSHSAIPDNGVVLADDERVRRRSRSIAHNSPNESHVIQTFKARRILKPIAGVDAWQTGRRYLIAPAVLAACPTTTAVTFMLGSTSLTSHHGPAQQSPAAAAAAAPWSLYNPFATIVLGNCLLSYVAAPKSSHGLAAVQPPQWSTAQLVVRQNYLLEYDVGVADVRTCLPRGYAHLQFASTVVSPNHFDDTLELHFYGSPCAKDDARILMIRIASPSAPQQSGDTEGTSGNDAAMERTKLRDEWRTCLNRASELAKVSDLYDYDESNELLGKGQYAEVRAARRKTPSAPTDSTEYDCALKIFDKNQFWRMVLKGRERADTIVREVSVQATLLAKSERSSSFLNLRGFFETASMVVLELELLQGTDLFQYIVSQGTIKESEAALIMRDVLSCLYTMSRNGLAHRDIKPANILMCNDALTINGPPCASPRVKIGDFGMAAFVGVDGQFRGRCGTPGYVSPEILTAGVYGGYGNKVDVFSAGVTLYVMLCGYEPFYGENDDELKEANKAAVFDFPNEEWNNVSTEAMDLVRQMMQIDPVKRLDAGQALQHPWFAKHLGAASENNSVVSVQSYQRTDDACRLS